MHTEEEARQRWCPFARIIGVKSAHGVGSAVSGNREAGKKRREENERRKQMEERNKRVVCPHCLKSIRVRDLL